MASAALVPKIRTSAEVKCGAGTEILKLPLCEAVHFCSVSLSLGIASSYWPGNVLFWVHLISLTDRGFRNYWDNLNRLVSGIDLSITGLIIMNRARAKVIINDITVPVRTLLQSPIFNRKPGTIYIINSIFVFITCKTLEKKQIIYRYKPRVVPVSILKELYIIIHQKDFNPNKKLRLNNMKYNLLRIGQYLCHQV